MVSHLRKMTLVSLTPANGATARSALSPLLPLSTGTPLLLAPASNEPPQVAHALCGGPASTQACLRRLRCLELTCSCQRVAQVLLLLFIERGLENSSARALDF